MREIVKKKWGNHDELEAAYKVKGMETVSYKTR